MRIEEKRRPAKNERGASLVIALLASLVLSVLSAGIIFVTQTETLTTANYKTLAQARYAAEAGVQRTINWLSNNYTAPTSFAAYNTSATPVRCVSGCANTGSIVLSAVSGVTSNYPDATVATAYQTALSNQALTGISNASYSTSATMNSMTPGTGASWLAAGGASQTWQITSQGNISGIRNATVQVVATFERTSSPIFTYAVFGNSPGCASVSFSGGGGTDSFDSSAGTYLTTEQLTSGNIGSNGNFDLSGGGGTAPLINVFVVIRRPPRTGTGNCVSGSPDALSIGSGWTTGALTQLTAASTYPTPLAPSPLPPTTSQSIRNNCSTITGCSCYPGGGYACTNNGPYQLTSGLSYGNLLMSGGKILHLSAGTYRVNSISLGGGSTIIVDSGPVIVNVAAQGISTGTCCAADFSGGSVSNLLGTPSDFQLVYAGSALIKMSGGSGAYGVVYAPNSAVSIGGGGDFYGAIIGSTVDNSGGTSIHFDRSLQNQFLSGVGGYRCIGFSWSKF